MKNMKKMIALLLAMTMVMAMGMTVFAAKTVEVGDGNGSITLENGTTGQKYQLYKVFDATYSGTNVSYTFTKTDANAEFYTALTASTSPFTVTATATENKYQVVKKDGVADADLITWVTNNVKDKAYMKVGTEITLAEADEQKIIWSKLAYGYYLITSDLGDKAVTIDSNIPNVSVIDKNQVPSFDKNIVTQEDGKEKLVKINDAGISIDVPFDITVKSKNYEKEEKIFQYVIYDTLDNGFTLKAAPVVKVDGTEKIAGTDYTISYKDKDGNATTDLAKAQYFEINIKWTSDGTVNGTHLYKANDEINVRYKAFLDPAKYDQIHFGATPNLNKADTKYYKGTDQPDHPSGDLPDQETKTYETKLTIQKTDQDKQPLAGAEFQLTGENGIKYTVITGQEMVADANGEYYKLKNGKYTKEAPNGNPTHDADYESTTDKYKLNNFTNVVGDPTGTTDLKAFVKEDGTLTFAGLYSGKYKLVETVVPDGYNKADDIEFTISFNPATEKFASDNPLIVLDSANNVFNTTVENKKGTELPSTGGIGTTMFYVVGSILVIGAAVLLISKKRMSTR